MKERVKEALKSFNNESEYNVDVLFYEDKNGAFAQVFTRFGEDGEYDKFLRTLKLDTSSIEDVRDSANEVITSAKEKGFEPTEESRTSGEL